MQLISCLDLHFFLTLFELVYCLLGFSTPYWTTIKKIFMVVSLSSFSGLLYSRPNKNYSRGSFLFYMKKNLQVPPQWWYWWYNAGMILVNWCYADDMLLLCNWYDCAIWLGCRRALLWLVWCWEPKCHAAATALLLTCCWFVDAILLPCWKTSHTLKVMNLQTGWESKNSWTSRPSTRHH